MLPSNSVDKSLASNFCVCYRAQSSDLQPVSWHDEAPGPGPFCSAWRSSLWANSGLDLPTESILPATILQNNARNCLFCLHLILLPFHTLSFGGMVLCNPGWPWICCIVMDDLEILIPPPPTHTLPLLLRCWAYRSVPPHSVLYSAGNLT